MNKIVMPDMMDQTMASMIRAGQWMPQSVKVGAA